LSAGLRWFGWSYVKNFWAAIFEPSRTFVVCPLAERPHWPNVANRRYIRAAMLIGLLSLIGLFWLVTQVGK
jgi:hypothetical protein